MQECVPLGMVLDNPVLSSIVLASSECFIQISLICTVCSFVQINLMSRYSDLDHETLKPEPVPGWSRTSYNSCFSTAGPV